MSAIGRFRLLRRVLLTWFAITGLTVVPYAIAFAYESPEWTEAYFTPLMFVYAPAAYLAFAFTRSDFPLIQFGIFVMIENVLISLLLVGVGILFRRWRRQPDDPA